MPRQVTLTSEPEHMNENTRTLFHGSRFDVVELTQMGNDGQPHARQIVRHPGAVVILPFVTPEQVCLIRNHRVAVGQTLLELPAGTREGDESPELTAARELQEETGFRVGSMRLLHSFYPSPGILNEEMFLYVAEELVAGSPAREAGEMIENHVVDFSAALTMVDRGEIRDAKTIVGLLLWARKRSLT